MKLLLLAATLLICANSKCAYTQPPPGGLPYPYDGQAFPQNYTFQMCKDYIGQDVCCNEHNAKLTADNFKQLDGAFGGEGGCDICSINLKRLWCEYACSPRQAEFLKVSKEYYTYPDPQKPGKTIVAQQANLTVEASTACALYEACKRVAFVTSVSAMSSPAGFLSFQGHNAINNALQFISVSFTYNKSEGLYFGEDSGRQATGPVDSCDYKGTELHGFQIDQACTCNSCEESCDPNEGFQYFESNVFQGFNTTLVLSFYGFTFLVVIIVTYLRYRSQKKKQE